MSRMSYVFNSAITGVDSDNGKFDSKAHDKAVLPLRGRVMAHDGMTGCHIARYGLEVEYLTEVTTPEAVDQVVQDAVSWAATEGNLFPMQGNKKVTVKREKAEPRKTNKVKIAVRFNTHLVRFNTSDVKSGWDKAAFLAQVHPLTQQLTDHDGVLGYELYVQSASLTIDTRYVTVEEAEVHMRRIFDEAARNSDGEAKFFPYVNGATLSLNFSREYNV